MAKKRNKKKRNKHKTVPGSPDYGALDENGNSMLGKHFVVPKVWEADPEETGKPVLHRKNVTQTVLDRYFHKGFITNRQHRTGCRLRRQFRIAGLDSLVSIDMVRTGSGVPAWGIPTSEAASDARVSIRKAFDSVGRSLTKVLMALVHDDRDVLQELSTLSGGFKNEAQRRAALAGIIVMALDTLADFYGEPIEN